MIELLWPWVFLLSPLPLFVRWLTRHAQARQAALTVPNLAPYQPDGTAPKQAGRDSRLPLTLILLTLAWLALLLAAARPQWTGDPVALPTSGRDLMLAVDISGSMGAEDMQLGREYVDRLSVVKKVVSDFVEARAGDRVGLILFGTNAYLQAPLTFDLATVMQLLREAPVGIAGGRTAIGDAIGLGVKRLRQRPEGDRVMILLTDGAGNAGEVAPIKASELAADIGVRIYTIGIGATEMRMPGVFGRFGSRIVNPSAELDEDTLTQVAKNTNARYFRAQNTTQLQEIYAIIDSLEPVEQEAETFRPVQALFMWPLGVGFGLLVLCLLLNSLSFRSSLFSSRRGAQSGI